LFNKLIYALLSVIAVPAEELWKGVVGVSNAGKKKGRAKRVGRKRVTDLNKGQMLGSGTTIVNNSNRKWRFWLYAMLFQFYSVLIL